MAFEMENKRRLEPIELNQRIRNIASHEINKVFNSCVALGVGAAAWWEYGALGGVGVALAVAVFAWFQSSSKKRNPFWMIEEIDDLAQDSVTQEQIVEWERQDRVWITIEEKNLHYEDFFAYPFWQNVQSRVQSYSRMTHKNRNADNAATRQASLPFRIAMQARIKDHDLEFDLPYWARLNSTEVKKQAGHALT